VANHSPRGLREEKAMVEYNVLYADPNCEPRAVSFYARTPTRAFTVAQRHHCPAHVFKEWVYLCTLEHWCDFWIISHDPDGAHAALGNRSPQLQPTRPQPSVALGGVQIPHHACELTI
jgi:hypothetical protein